LFSAKPIYLGKYSIYYLINYNKKLYTMKKLLRCILYGLCCGLWACVDVEPLGTVRPEACEQPNDRLRILRAFARVRNITVWVPERPATAEEISEGLVNMRPLNLWLIVGGDESLYEPCNLPDEFRVDRMEVFIDAYILSEAYNNPFVEGIVPISITEIEEDL
jgi:hypothetical protein